MTTTDYRPDIQGLRAVAVVLVILFHFNPAWLPGGFVGVDVFLVISGYLMAGVLLERKGRLEYGLAGTIRQFYVSRFKRIAPAYFAMLVLVSIFAAVLFLPQDFDIYKKSLNQAAWFNSNHHFAVSGDYFAPASHEQPLLHTWSLAVEIQFYLLAPLLFLLVPTRALPWLLAILLIGLTAVAEYRLRILNIHQETYYSLYSRLPAFFAGALVALWLRMPRGGKPLLGSLGLVLVLASAAVQPLLGPFPGMLALLPVAGAALVLMRPPQVPAKQILANKPMVWVGERSYSLYLWHWPVLSLLRYYTGSEVLDIPHSLLFIVLTLLLTTLSYHVIEMPLRLNRVRIKQLLGYGVLSSAFLVTSLSMASINKALSPPGLPTEYLRYADPSTICHGQIVADCLKGDLNSTKEVLVLGDSHAAMLNLFFDQLGKELGFKARIITASSCVTIPDFDYQRLPEWAHNPCKAQIKHAQKYLPTAKVVFLAGMWSYQLASTDFQRVLQTFLSVENKTEARIYLIEQVPLLRKSPLRALRLQSMGLATSRIDLDPVYQQSNANLQRLTSSNPNVTSLNFESGGFFFRAPFSDGILVYMDESHLNEEGAKRYALAIHADFKKKIMP
jgi:peptidoglycan/LPS O-acetylase OafA/YrhL